MTGLAEQVGLVELAVLAEGYVDWWGRRSRPITVVQGVIAESEAPQLAVVLRPWSSREVELALPGRPWRWMLAPVAAIGVSGRGRGVDLVEVAGRHPRCRAVAVAAADARW